MAIDSALKMTFGYNVRHLRVRLKYLLAAVLSLDQKRVQVYFKSV